jgi:hypothetical protein
MASVCNAVYRIAFKRGSPQRIHYSQRLTVGALLGLILIAVATQLLVFRADLIGVCLYLFAATSGLYLGVAWLSRRTSPPRLRQALQAGLLILATSHLLVLPAAPFAIRFSWLPYLAALTAAAVALSGLTGCVHFALGGSRATALSYALVFAFAVAAFYATMRWLLSIAMA